MFWNLIVHVWKVVWVKRIFVERTFTISDNIRIAFYIGWIIFQFFATSFTVCCYNLNKYWSFAFARLLYYKVLRFMSIQVVFSWGKIQSHLCDGNKCSFMYLSVRNIKLMVSNAETWYNLELLPNIWCRWRQRIDFVCEPRFRFYVGNESKWKNLHFVLNYNIKLFWFLTLWTETSIVYLLNLHHFCICIGNILWENVVRYLNGVGRIYDEVLIWKDKINILI